MPLGLDCDARWTMCANTPPRGVGTDVVGVFTTFGVRTTLSCCLKVNCDLPHPSPPPPPLPPLRALATACSIPCRTFTTSLETPTPSHDEEDRGDEEEEEEDEYMMYLPPVVLMASDSMSTTLLEMERGLMAMVVVERADRSSPHA